MRVLGRRQVIERHSTRTYGCEVYSSVDCEETLRVYSIGIYLWNVRYPSEYEWQRRGQLGQMQRPT